MVNKNPIVKNNINESSNWLYVVLFITLAMTAWTAFNNEKSTGVDNDLVADKFGSDSKKHQSAHPLSSGIEKLKLNDTALISNSDSLIPWQELKREAMKKNPHDVFKIHSWLVVSPVKKVKPLPLPPPVAPNIPFTYAGKLENSPKGTQVFLMGNSKLYSVVMGEKVDAQWRMDSEDANTLQFTYLPLNLKQALSKSAKQARPVVEEINQ